METKLTMEQMFRSKHENIWNTKIQQRAALLNNHVTLQRNCSGKSINMDFHGTTRMKEYRGRFEKITWSHPDFAKRVMRRRKFYNSIPLEEDDKIDMAKLDFAATEVIDMQMPAIARMYDEVILGVVYDESKKLYRVRTAADGVCGGILGINYTGDEGTTFEHLESDPTHHNVIAANYVATGSPVESGMGIDKLVNLHTRYLQLNCFDHSDIVVAISPLQHQDLMREEELRNLDYGFNCLTDGRVNNFMHCKFIVTNMLPLDENGHRQCVAWLKSKVKFGVWQDATFRKEARTEYTGVQEQFTVKASCGATRLDSSAVFLMPCAEHSTSA